MFDMVAGICPTKKGGEGKSVNERNRACKFETANIWREFNQDTGHVSMSISEA